MTVSLYLIGSYIKCLGDSTSWGFQPFSKGRVLWLPVDSQFVRIVGGGGVAVGEPLEHLLTEVARCHRVPILYRRVQLADGVCKCGCSTLEGRFRAGTVAGSLLRSTQPMATRSRENRALDS